MIKPLTLSSDRLSVVDALRGMALFAIVILHSYEHYNLYCFPETLPDWMRTFDRSLWDATWFMMAGKAFAAFALLFGFSFYIQFENARKRGIDFRGRFLWRMVLLFGFGQLHALFYNGDILVLYSIVGMFMVLFCKLSTKALLIIATIMFLQPLEWLRFIVLACGGDFFEYGNHFMKYAMLAEPVMRSGNFGELVWSNITDGQLYSNLWQVEHGRFFQVGSLFLYGMVLGRTKMFIKSETSTKWWKTIMLWSIVLFVPFYLLAQYAPNWVGDANELRAPLDIALPSIRNCLFMAFLMATYVLVWFRKGGYGFQKMFIPYGRMTLTNYIVQSAIGVTIYYGFGFGLFQHTGATYSLLIAVGIVGAQILFSRWWLSSHTHGPLEYLWKKATWVGSKKSKE